MTTWEVYYGKILEGFPNMKEFATEKEAKDYIYERTGGDGGVFEDYIYINYHENMEYYYVRANSENKIFKEDFKMTAIYNNSGKYRMAEDDGMIDFADFGSYELADLFVTCFNSYLQSSGKVSFADISVSLDHSIPKDLANSYATHGYIDAMDSSDIRTFTDSETGTRYRVCFPMHVKDFSVKEDPNA